MTPMPYDEAVFPDRVNHVRRVQVTTLGNTTESPVTLAEGVPCSIQEMPSARADGAFQSPGAAEVVTVYYRTDPGLATGDQVHGTGIHEGRVLNVIMCRPQQSFQMIRWRCDAEERR